MPVEDSHHTPAGPAVPVEKEWFSVRDACHFASVSKPTLYSWLNRGLIRNVALRERGRIKGKRLVSVQSLRHFLESRATGGEPVSKPEERQ